MCGWVFVIAVFRRANGAKCCLFEDGRFLRTKIALGWVTQVVEIEKGSVWPIKEHGKLFTVSHLWDALRLEANSDDLQRATSWQQR